MIETQDNDENAKRELFADRALRLYRLCLPHERAARWAAYQAELRRYGYRDKNAPDDPEELDRWVGPDCTSTEVA